MSTTTDTITISTIVGRYEKVNPASPGPGFDNLVIYIVATEKGTLRAVTSAGPLAKYDRTSPVVWSRNAQVGDRMSITLDTQGRGHRRLGGWLGDTIIGIATTDFEGNAEHEGNVPNRNIPRYYCD